MTELSDYLNEANRERGLSARRIAELATPPISHSNVSRVLRGAALYPTEETLLSFASVLPVSITRLRELAGQPGGEQQPYVPPPEANRLTFQQRRALDQLIRSIVGADKAHAARSLGQEARDARPLRAAAPDEYGPDAARRTRKDTQP